MDKNLVSNALPHEPGFLFFHRAFLWSASPLDSPVMKSLRFTAPRGEEFQGITAACLPQPPACAVTADRRRRTEEVTRLQPNSECDMRNLEYGGWNGKGEPSHVGCYSFERAKVTGATIMEKTEVVTNCDRLKALKFSPVLPNAFTEHGAIMAANVLSSPQAVTMSVFVVRAFVKMREALGHNRALLPLRAKARMGIDRLHFPF